MTDILFSNHNVYVNAVTRICISCLGIVFVSCLYYRPSYGSAIICVVDEVFFLQFLYYNLAVANRSRVNNAHGVFRVSTNIDFSNGLCHLHLGSLKVADNGTFCILLESSNAGYSSH